MGKPQPELIERRRFTRKLVNARVKLMHGTFGEILARTRDVSDSGVFVEMNPVPKLPVGAHVKMYMLDSSMPNVAFNMKVTRSTADGVGMMFVDFEVDGERYSINELREHFKNK